MPTTTEGLRQKYRIMSNWWLLAQMRQPARHLFSDLTVRTFTAFCDELLSNKSFQPEKEIGGHNVIKPEWVLCMGYELELRREAIRLTKEQRMSIQQAMWAAYRDQQHRLENWSNFLKLESKRREESSKDAQIVSLKKCLKQMENRLNQRSRSPRGKGRGKRSHTLALPTPAQLALPAPAAPQGGQSRGKERGKAVADEEKESIKIRPRARTSEELINRKQRTIPEWFRSPPGVFFAFNQKKCTDTARTRPHVCVACGAQSRTMTAVVCKPELMPLI